MKHYTFNITDKGYLGKAFEMAIKDALNRKNADKVSPCGRADLRFKSHNYDIKQNGSVIQYAPDEKLIKGSSRVIYASHIAYQVIARDDKTITIAVDLGATNLLVVDRTEFLEFLTTERGLSKYNAARGQLNIQTGYNYSKDAYHGRVGKRIEEWAWEHECDDDDIIDAILEGLS